MKTRTYAMLMVVLLVSLLVPTSVGLAKGKPPELPLELTGDIDGAAFVIRVPENWNGTLLLHAHGYSSGPVDPPAAAILDDPGAWVDPEALNDSTATLLLENGYALAASGFRADGWAIEEGIVDMKRLLLYFQQHVAHPSRTVIYGTSMGNVIALGSIEKGQGLYDAAVSMCGADEGATRNADLKLDFTLAYAAAFGWDPSWGPIGDPPDGDEGFAVYGQIVDDFNTRFWSLPDPSQSAEFEFIRLVNDMPLGAFYDGQSVQLPYPGAMLNTMLGYYLRYELESRAGGPVAQNVDHVYSLSADDRDRLADRGMTEQEMDDLLAWMNSMTNIEADKSARKYLERYVDYKGNIHVPVLIFHNIEDPLVPVEATDAYYETLAAKGKEGFLTRVYTDRPGHCNFTPEQVLVAFQAMDGWLDTGTAPTANDFPVELEFVFDYEPGPWPQPSQ